jgi:hypothetical protein
MHTQGSGKERQQNDVGLVDTVLFEYVDGQIDRTASALKKQTRLAMRFELGLEAHCLTCDRIQKQNFLENKKYKFVCVCRNGSVVERALLEP